MRGEAMTVQITRLEHDADALRQHAGRVSKAPVARRLLALALVLAGHSRVEAAKSCGMDRQTLRDWVIRYNEHGLAGLSDLPKRGGAAPKLSVEKKGCADRAGSTRSRPCGRWRRALAVMRSA